MKQVKKTFKKLIRKSFSALPAQTRGKLLRRMVNLNLDEDPRFTFRLAETQEELEQAFRLLHVSYVREGFMKPDPSGMRVTVYHALPTTSTIIAKWDDHVIGTVTFIRRTGLGLPLEKAFSLEKLDRNGAQFVEISSLAIERDFQRQTNILFLLCKFLYEYCLKYFGIDYLVIAVNPRDCSLYQDVMLFEKLQGTIVRSYDFVNGAPAVGLYMDLRKAHNRLLEVYWNMPPQQNLFTFFMASKTPLNFHFPTRRYYKVFDPVMTPEMLDHFFNRTSQIFKDLSAKELQTVRMVYGNSPKHLEVIPPVSDEHIQMLARRKMLRFRVKFHGIGEIKKNKLAFDIKILEVGQNGFLGIPARDLEMNEAISVRIAISEYDVTEVEAKVLWKEIKGTAGFQILNSDQAWSRLLASLKAEVPKVATHQLRVGDRRKTRAS